MNSTVKITTIGNSIGIVLSKEILTLLNVEKGDLLYITRTPDGVELSAYDKEFASMMEIGRKVMREDRDLLKRLADS